MTVLSLAQQAAQAGVNSVPCRTYDADPGSPKTKPAPIAPRRSVSNARSRPLASVRR